MWYLVSASSSRGQSMNHIWDFPWSFIGFCILDTNNWSQVLKKIASYNFCSNFAFSKDVCGTVSKIRQMFSHTPLQKNGISKRKLFQKNLISNWSGKKWSPWDLLMPAAGTHGNVSCLFETRHITLSLQEANQGPKVIG